MPAERSATNGKARAGSAGRPSKKVEPCVICGKVVSRASDTLRHMKTHDRNAEKFSCPWDGCNYSTLQKVNLNTHYRRHTRDKSLFCIDDPECKFRTCDPASLHRHRKRLHGYIPGGRKTGMSSSSASTSIDSSSSSFLESTSPVSTMPSSSSSVLSESPYFFPFGESPASFLPEPETLFSLNESVPRTLPPQAMDSSSSSIHCQSLLFPSHLPPYSYNYNSWDSMPLLPEMDFFNLLPTNGSHDLEAAHQSYQASTSISTDFNANVNRDFQTHTSPYTYLSMSGFGFDHSADQPLDRVCQW